MQRIRGQVVYCRKKQYKVVTRRVDKIFCKILIGVYFKRIIS